MKPLAVLGQLLSQVIERIPLERLLIKPPSNKKRLEDLQEILSESHVKPTEAIPEKPFEETAQEAKQGYLEPHRQRVHLEQHPLAGLSTEETVKSQNLELGKVLVLMEKHCTQKFRRLGKPCDCGQSRHLLELEGLSEETVSMVDNPEVYYRIIEVGRELGPKCTVEAAASGIYDNEYPAYSRKYRDFRKELLGTLDVKALYPKGEQQGAGLLPVASEEQTVAEV